MESIYEYKDTDFGLSHTLTPQPDPSIFRLHTHAMAELYFFIQGGGVFHIEGSAYPLERGDLLVLQPAESHYIELDPSQPYERIVLHFDPEALRDVDPDGQLLAPLFRRTPGKRNLYKPLHFPGGLRQFPERMLAPLPDPRVSIFAGLLPLLHEMCRILPTLPEDPSPDTEPVAQRIMRYLNENLEAPITLQSLCSRFYLSRSQLCRLFRDAAGVTVKQYLTAKRLVRAKQLLDEGKQPTHVFQECGFSDYSGFYRAYRSYFGHPPSK
jgi:AraC-like DNA-binding protein